MLAGLRLATAMRRTAAAIALATACTAVRAAAPERLDLTVTTSDGRVVRIADYRGRWLLVNYWATWCGSCIVEMPVLSRLVERRPQLSVLGLTDEKLTAEELSTFVAAHPVSYAVASIDGARMPDALPPTAFGIGMRPISYLIAPDGTVVERFLGEVDVRALERRIDARPR